MSAMAGLKAMRCYVAKSRDISSEPTSILLTMIDEIIEDYQSDLDTQYTAGIGSEAVRIRQQGGKTYLT